MLRFLPRCLDFDLSLCIDFEEIIEGEINGGYKKYHGFVRGFSLALKCIIQQRQ
jgi:hypothetical protein